MQVVKFDNAEYYYKPVDDDSVNVIKSSLIRRSLKYIFQES